MVRLIREAAMRPDVAAAKDLVDGYEVAILTRHRLVSTKLNLFDQALRVQVGKTAKANNQLYKASVPDWETIGVEIYWNGEYLENTSPSAHVVSFVLEDKYRRKITLRRPAGYVKSDSEDSEDHVDHQD